MIIALPKIIDVFASASVNIVPGKNTFLAGQQALRAEGRKIFGCRIIGSIR